MDLSYLNLPVSVENNVKFYPYEDLLVEMFKYGLPELQFKTLIPERMTYPLVVGRRFLKQGAWSGDPRFIDKGPVRINVFTEGQYAEDQGFFISEAIRVMMLKAKLEKWRFPGIGSIVNIEMETEPSDESDWATASGIVQFADLPKHVKRRETVYRMTIRRPQSERG